VFAGSLLRLGSLKPTQRTLRLILAGLACLAVGWVWSGSFPIVKKLWTSSFVLFAGGWSFLLLAGFYQVVDGWGQQRWCQPFVWIGTNPITLYLLSSFVGYGAVAGRFLTP